MRRGMKWTAPAVLAVVLAGLTAPEPARAQSGCPEANPVYTDACGPTFVLPGWGDAGGWSDPSQYSTIQLADCQRRRQGRAARAQRPGPGDLVVRHERGAVAPAGRRERRCRWRCRTSGRRAPGETLATDLTSRSTTRRSRPPTSTAHGWKRSWRASRTACMSTGTRLRRASKSIDGGSWSLIVRREARSRRRRRSATPTRLLDDPLAVLRSPTGHYAGGGSRARWPSVGRSRSGAERLPWTAFVGAVPLNDASAIVADAGCGTAVVLRGVPRHAGTSRTMPARVGRAHAERDQHAHRGTASTWGAFPGSAQSSVRVGRSTAERRPFTDVPGGCGLPVRRGQRGDCLGSSPSYYETLQAATSTAPGRRGPRSRQRRAAGQARWDGGGPTDRAADADRAGRRGVDVQPGEWGSIRTGDIDGDGATRCSRSTATACRRGPTTRPRRRGRSCRRRALGLTGDWLTNAGVLLDDPGRRRQRRRSRRRDRARPVRDPDVVLQPARDAAAGSATCPSGYPAFPTRGAAGGVHRAQRDGPEKRAIPRAHPRRVDAAGRTAGR